MYSWETIPPNARHFSKFIWKIKGNGTGAFFFHSNVPLRKITSLSFDSFYFNHILLSGCAFYIPSRVIRKPFSGIFDLLFIAIPEFMGIFQEFIVPIIRESLLSSRVHRPD